MRVLIGIVSKNRCAVLPKAITSGLEQACPDVSIKVIDDHSSDGTRLLENKFPTVQWEFLTEAKGYVDARNRFMKETNATYFCSLDDDSWFMTKEGLAKAVDYLNCNPSVAATGFDILSPEHPEKNFEGKPIETNAFIGCGHVLRLSAVREVGYYDPSPSLYGGEEVDICMRLMDKGYKIMFMPGVHVWHDKINLVRDEKVKYKSVVCNDLIFLYRRSPHVMLLPALALKMVSHLRFSAFYKKGILFSSAWSGIMRFLSLFFTLRRKPVSMTTFRKYFALNKKYADAETKAN
jgi:GT2 family glycosyltransferase